MHESAGIIAGSRVGRCETFYVAKLRMLIRKMASMQRKVSLTAQVVFNSVRSAVSGSLRTSRLSTTFHKQSGTHQISGLASISRCVHIIPSFPRVSSAPLCSNKRGTGERLGTR